MVAAQIAVVQAHRAEDACRDAYLLVARVNAKRNPTRLTPIAALQFQVERVRRWTAASVASAAARRRLLTLEEALLDLEGLTCATCADGRRP